MEPKAVRTLEIWTFIQQNPDLANAEALPYWRRQVEALELDPGVLEATLDVREDTGPDPLPHGSEQRRSGQNAKFCPRRLSVFQLSKCADGGPSDR